MGANLLPRLQEGFGDGGSLNPAVKGHRSGCALPLAEKHAELRYFPSSASWLMKLALCETWL